MPSWAAALRRNDSRDGTIPIVQRIDADGFLTAVEAHGGVVPALPMCVTAPNKTDAPFVAAARSDLLLRLKDVVKHWVDHCEMTKIAGRGFFKAGAFERVASGALDIGYVSKTGCRYLGLWPLPPVVKNR